MKKFTKLFMALMVLSLVSNASYAQYFSEDFSAGMPAGFTNTDVDGLTPNAGVSAIFTSAWVVNAQQIGAVAASTSWYTPAGQADDWMGTSAINLTGSTAPRVTWTGMAMSANFPDGYEVYVSTVGATPTDFLAGTMVFSVAGETGTVTPHAADLTAFNGQTIYIGWRNNSNDAFILQIDDIVVEETPATDAIVTSGAYVPSDFLSVPMSQASFGSFSSLLRNNGASTINAGQVINLNINNGTYTDSYSTAGALASLGTETATFTGTFVPTAVGLYQGVFNTVLAGDVNAANDYDSAFSVLVTDTIMGIEAGGNATFFGTKDLEFANRFEVFVADTVTSLSVDHLFPVGSDGATIQYHIYDMNTDTAFQSIATTTPYTVLVSDTGLANFGTHTLPIIGGKVLAPGVYFIYYSESASIPSASVAIANYTHADKGSYVRDQGSFGGFSSAWVRIEQFTGGDKLALSMRANFGHLSCNLTATATNTNVTTNGGSDGSATAVPAGNQGNLTYVWSNSGTTVGISGLAAGTYTVTLTDDVIAACTATASVTVTEPVAGCNIAATATGVPVTTNGGSDGSAGVLATGAVGTVTYLWSQGSTAQNIAGLTAGVYTVTVFDAGVSGCSTTGSVTITEPAVSCNLTVTTTSTADNCGQGGTATATASNGTGTISYNWSNGSNNQMANNLSAGTYSITVTDANSCTASASVTVSGSAGVTLNTITITDAACGVSDGTAVISVATGTAPYTYSWTDLNGTAVGGNTASVTGLAAGGILVSVTDANGCSNDDGGPVNNTGAASVTVTTTDISCNGTNDGTATVVATGGVAPLTYSWSEISAPTVILGTSTTITGLGTGNYIAQVTGADNCVALDGANVNEPSMVSASLTASDVSTAGAADGSVSASGNGGSGSGYTYTWSNSGATAMITGLSGGTYTVTVTDSKGCTGIASAGVAEAGVCTVNISAIAGNVTSNGGSNGTVTTTVSGDQGTLTYAWSNSAGNVDNISNLTAGTYSVTVTDASIAGCTSTATITVTEPTATSVQELTVGNGFLMYPNPSEGSFVIELDATKASTVAVRNVLGQIVFNQNITSSRVNVELKNVETGMYFVTIANATSQQTQRIIIK